MDKPKQLYVDTVVTYQNVAIVVEWMPVALCGSLFHYA